MRPASHWQRASVTRSGSVEGSVRGEVAACGGEEAQLRRLGVAHARDAHHERRGRAVVAAAAVGTHAELRPPKFISQLNTPTSAILLDVIDAAANEAAAGAGARAASVQCAGRGAAEEGGARAEHVHSHSHVAAVADDTRLQRRLWRRCGGGGG